MGKKNGSNKGKRGGTNAGLEKAVKKVVRKMSETKCHYDAVNIATSVSTDGNVQQLVDIPAGTAGDQRIGTSVQLRHLKIRAILHNFGSGITVGSQMRIMLFYSSTEPFLAGDLGSYLTSTYNPKRFFPLYDRFHAVAGDYNGTAANPRSIQINITKRIRYYQKYREGGTLDRGHLTLAVNHNNNAQVSATLQGRMEVWYDDI